MRARLEYFRKWSPELGEIAVALTLLASLSFLAGTITQSTLDSNLLADKDALLATKDDMLADREATIQNYRLALGIDEANNGAFVALTNQELAAASTILSAKMRRLCLSVDAQQGKIETLRAGRVLDAGTASARLFELLAKRSNDFKRTLQSNAFTLDAELRRRLSEKANATVPNFPPFGYDVQISAVGLMPVDARMSVGSLCLWADRIEQMAEVLPITTRRDPESATALWQR